MVGGTVGVVVGVAVSDLVVVAVVGAGAGAGAVVVVAVVGAGAGAVVVAAVVAAGVSAWVVDHQMVSPPRHPENAMLFEQAQFAIRHAMHLGCSVHWEERMLPERCAYVLLMAVAHVQLEAVKYQSSKGKFPTFKLSKQFLSCKMTSTCSARTLV